MHHSLTKDFLSRNPLPAGTAWLFGQCMEYRGKQDLWLQTRPAIMKALRESAIIQSAESSNRIEGVEIEKKRLIPLLAGKTRPRSRSEEAVLGYKKALAEIHKKYTSIDITPKSVMTIHRMAQAGTISDAGEWKTRDNDIIEIQENGESSIRFKPLSASKTPHAMEQLCTAYNHSIQKETVPDLVAMALFVLDFLCVHPFRDGNGRVSRLLTVLLLHQHNYQIGRYISLERIIENSKEEYYHALKESSNYWHQGQHNPVPWLNYLLSTIKTAYKDLSERVQLSDGPDQKQNLVRQIILEQLGSFSLSDIQNLCPQVSSPLIKRVLAELKDEKTIKLEGKGRGAKWKLV